MLTVGCHLLLSSGSMKRHMVHCDTGHTALGYSRRGWATATIGCRIVTPKVLYAYRTDRLLSRVRNALIAWRFGRKFNCPTVVVWPQTSPSYAKYDGEKFYCSQIFDLPRLSLDYSATRLTFVDGAVPAEVSSNWLLRWDRIILSKGEVLESSEIFDESGIGYFGGHQWLRMTGEPVRSVQSEVSELFRTIPIAPKISALASEALANIDISNAIGVHIRRGDLIDTMRLAVASHDGGSANTLEKATRFLVSKTIPKSVYKTVFRHRRIREKDLILFSDDGEMGNTFLLETGRRGVVVNNDRRLSPIENDFLAFFILAKCKMIVGGGSTFSGLASLVGGGEFVNLQRFCKRGDYIEMLDSEVFPGCFDMIDSRTRFVIDDTLDKYFSTSAVVNIA